MSIPITTLIVRRRHYTDRSTVMVMTVLANHADAEGLSYPGVQTIADEGLQSVSMAKANLARLKKDGFITVERGVGRGNFSGYRLNVKKLEKLPMHGSPKSDSESDKGPTTDPFNEINGPVIGPLSDSINGPVAEIKGPVSELNGPVESDKRSSGKKEMVQSGAINGPVEAPPSYKEEVLREVLTIEVLREVGDAGARAKPPIAPIPKPASGSPAETPAEVYERVFGLVPAVIFQDQMNTLIPEGDLQKWEASCQMWKDGNLATGRKYNPGSIPDLLKKYEKDFGAQSANGGGNGNGNRQPASKSEAWARSIGEAREYFDRDRKQRNSSG